MRQEILKELKFLLNEQEEAGGTGMLSEDLDDLLQDVNDCETGSIAGLAYLNLTNFGDDIDEGELAKIIEFGKAIKSEKSLSDPDAKNAFNKMCKTPLLLINRAGRTDTYFYVICRSVGGLKVPVSARKLVDEGNEAVLQTMIDEIIGQPPSPAPVTSSETGNFCSDPKNEGKPVPELINFICRGGQAVSTASTSGSDGGQSMTGKGNVKCKDPTLIVIYQQWLKYVKKQNVSVDGSYGPNTHAAAAKVLGETQTFEQVKNDPNRICNFATRKKAEWTAEIQKVAPKVKIGVPESGDGGKRNTSNVQNLSPEFQEANKRVSKIIVTLPDAQKLYVKDNNFRDAVLSAVISSPNTGIDQVIKSVYQKYTGSTLQESKNYYDNKKLNEAKQLFNKLLRDL
jgi:hypothetical protein